MKKIEKILFFGPQGCGKGTQAARLAKKLRLPAVSMGQLFREEVATGSRLGKKVAAVMAAGDLVAQKDTLAVLKSCLSRSAYRRGYILDGFPRNLAQFKAASFLVPTHVIVLAIPARESVRRISGRLTCDTCGAVFSVKDGYRAGRTCPICKKGQLIRRPDDEPAAIKRRLAIYQHDTKPILKAYAKMPGVAVHLIPGLGSEKQVAARVLRALAK